MFIKAGSTSDFAELQPIFIESRDRKIAVYRFQNRYYAYLDVCPHQLGPVCEGIVVGNSEAELESDRKVREYVSGMRYNIACPWHGAEFDVETGVWRSDERYRLASFEVEVQNNDVLVNVL